VIVLCPWAKKIDGKRPYDQAAGDGGSRLPPLSATELMIPVRSRAWEWHAGTERSVEGGLIGANVDGTSHVFVQEILVRKMGMLCLRHQVLLAHGPPGHGPASIARLRLHWAGQVDSSSRDEPTPPVQYG